MSKRGPTADELALLAIHIKDAPRRRREPDITRLRELMRVIERDELQRDGEHRGGLAERTKPAILG
jgi:hypothetical protein